MQIIITDAWMAKSRAIHLTGAKLLLALMLASFALMLVAALLYHWVFLKGARPQTRRTAGQADPTGVFG